MIYFIQSIDGGPPIPVTDGVIIEGAEMPGDDPAAAQGSRRPVPLKGTVSFEITSLDRILIDGTAEPVYRRGEGKGNGNGEGGDAPAREFPAERN